MVPPPDNTGDEFPDFESMSPEEQMAWLESLAKRQGVDDDELTTSADIDVPVPENAVVDEPGYVPYSISGKPKVEQAETPELEEPVAEPEPEPEPTPPEPAAEPMMEEAADESDPMHWLDSLAAHAGDELDELDFLDEDQFTEEAGDTEDLEELLLSAQEDESPELEFVFESELELPPEEPEGAAPADEGEIPEAAEVVSEEPPTELVAEEDEDLLEGADPMAWLETLAKRQGVGEDQLTTSADIDVGDMPEDAVIDEPGYEPFDIVSGGPKASEVESVGESEPEPAEPEASEPAAPAPQAEEPVAGLMDLALSEEELAMLDGADPMTWLETLAKRQGADAQEFTTMADLEIPELPEDTQVDEPGYVAYSPFESHPEGEMEDEAEIEAAAEPPENPEAPAAEAEPEPAMEFPGEVEAEAEADMGFEDESLAWLEDLASESDEDMADLLMLGEEEAFEAEAAEPVEPPAPSEIGEDLLAGMTDEEIAAAQARGELTGEQELAWLKRQAAQLTEARASEAAAQGEVEPAEPVEPEELPGWLQHMRSEAGAEQPVEVDAEAQLDDSTWSPDEEQVADWLSEEEPEAEFDMAELSLDSDVESLWAAEEEPEISMEAETVDESELAKFLESDLVPGEEDQLAEALDAEYDRKLTGDVTEPEWYTEAIASGAVETPAEPEEAPEEPEAPAPAGAEATPVAMPDWLQDVEAPPPEEAASEVPDWLTARIEEEEVPSATDTPDWLAAEEPVAEEPAPEFEAAAPPPPQPEPEPEVVEPAAQASLPEGELFAQYRQRLEADPGDHANRLALARALRANQQLDTSLDHYEVLIDASQFLEDVSSDLADLADEHPERPRMRRLLGDIYMRQGKLQEALDSYRSALDHL